MQSHTTLLLGCLIGAYQGLPYPLPFPLALPDGPPAGPLPIPRPGADGSFSGDNYFQYINVPAHKTFEWGYRRGNPEHNREEYLSQKDHTFKAKLKWHDGYGGHGEHFYDYNHAGPVYKEPAPAYAPEPVYAPEPAYAPPAYVAH